MSTLVVTNISDGTKTVSSTVVTEGGINSKSAFNQATVVGNSDQNIASTTDHGTGDYSATLTNSYASLDDNIATATCISTLSDSFVAMDTPRHTAGSLGWATTTYSTNIITADRDCLIQATGDLA